MNGEGVRGRERQTTAPHHDFPAARPCCRENAGILEVLGYACNQFYGLLQHLFPFIDSASLAISFAPWLVPKLVSTSPAALQMSREHTPSTAQRPCIPNVQLQLVLTTILNLKVFAQARGAPARDSCTNDMVTIVMPTYKSGPFHKAAIWQFDSIHRTRSFTTTTNFLPSFNLSKMNASRCPLCPLQTPKSGCQKFST